MIAPINRRVSICVHLRCSAKRCQPARQCTGRPGLHLVDMCAGIAAQRHARSPVVTAAIDQMSFMLPIQIGQLVILRSSVNRVFRTSMEVGVKVWMENPQTGEVRHTSSAYLTFVAIGEGGKPAAVAPVIAESAGRRTPIS